MILLSYFNSSIKGTEILGSVFNDYVVFYGDNALLARSVDLRVMVFSVNNNKY